MKILVIQDRLRSGGTERQSVFLTKAFREAGHKAELLTFRPGGDLAETAEDVQAPPLQPFDTGLDWFAPGLMNRVAEFAPDVVMTMGRMANAYASFIQKRFPAVAVVATMRTGKSLPWLYRRSLRLARHVVANSQQAASHVITQCALEPSRVSVVHNSLVFVPRPRRETGSSQASLRADQRASRQTLVILCVAMFRKEKNVREVIEIVNQLPRSTDWQLWLGGEGPERSTCEALVVNLGLQERVKFLGFLRDPQSVYRAADLAVLTSHRESLSNFLIEAQAHGLPAVAYNAQGVRECLVDGETGYAVEVGDQKAFLTLLENLMSNRERRQNFSAAARLHAQESFSSERQVKVYLAIFERLLQENAAAK